MSPESDHIFAVRCWKRTRAYYRNMQSPYAGMPDVGEINYMVYLTEIFSWMFDHGRIYRR